LIPHQQPRYWSLLGNQRGILFDLESIDGVNPVQSVRHWSFVRATQRTRIYYNASFYRQMSPLAADLLQVKAVLVDSAVGCDRKLVGGPAVPAAAEGRAVLCRLELEPPRAEVVGDWRVVGTGTRALGAVTAPAFDPESTVVLERSPGLPGTSGRATGTARYRSTGPQSAVVDVRSSGPALVLIRTSYDPNWRATVDGRPASVLAADWVDQAVAVPGGHHVVVLAYRDPWVGRGLLSSAVSIAAVGLAALWLAVARRRRGRPRRDAWSRPEAGTPT
jgi:hypothetical protein